MSEDLKIKIGSPEVVWWTDLKEKVESDNVNLKRQIEINTRIIIFAEEKIELEKKKLK